MAESIGVVVSVQGVVFAVQADGTERQIFAGDQVMAGEVIRTGPDARAEISIDGQGASFVLEGGQSWLATADTHQTPDDMDSSEAAADVDAIQAAILAGVDPTTVGEATAAGAPGAGTGGQGNEGSSFVTLTRTGEEVDPNAGYQTSTFGADPQQSSEDPGVEPLLTTAVSLTASSVTEDEPGIVVTVSLTTPGESDVTVTTNLGSVLIPAGTTTGVLFVETQDSDPYLDPDSIAVTVTGVSGGEFDEVDLSAAQATADIADTIDGTVLNLTAPDEVDEGTDLTYTATLSNAPQTDVQVTLSNGAAITILAGETSGSVTVPVQGDDVYTDGESLSVTVTGASGGNFEQLDVGSGASGSPVQTAVVDTLDDVTVDLSATDVSEDDPSVTFTATLSAPAGDEAVVVETSLGNITIAAGETSGTLVVDSSDPDVYLDPDTLEATINSVSGGSFESLVIGNGTAVADISDTIDTTTLNLSATEEVAEGGNITYSAVVDNPPQSDLTVELSNGSTITILAGATGGSVSVPAQSDDVYVDGETLSVTVVGTTGGNYEYLEVGSGSSENPVQTAVVDTIDDVTVDLTVADVTEDEAGVTFTATLSAPAGDQPVTIETNLGNITIGAGQSSGTLFVDTSDPDVYIDPDTISATITSASGGNFENLIIGNGSATADISDTIDTTTLNLSAPDSVAEGGTITYTATVSNPTQTELTVTLSNGETITIPAGGSSGSVSISAPADDIYDTGDVISVSVTQAEGGNYENLVIGEGSVTNPVETDVVDTPDDVTVNLTAGDVTEDEAGVTFTATLSAPAGTEPVTVETTLGTITIASGQSSGVLFVDTNDPDVYIDPDTVSATITSASGGSFENLIIGNGTAVANISDTIDTTTLNLSATNEVAEGGNITYSAVVDNPPQGNLTVELSNGAVITILSGNTGGSVSVPAPSDDVYVDGETLSVSVVNTTGGNYENLEVGTGSPESPVQTTVVDTIDAVTVDLSASNVTEDDAGVTFTATLSAPAGDQPVVVETSLGDITIAAGQSSGTLFVDTSDPDVYIDPDSISATITGASGGDFENLVIGNGTATANITDTIDVTTLTLAATPQVSEGGTITYTATVDNAPQGNLSVTLSNGVVITIASGATVGSASIAAPSDDVYNNSTTLTVTVDSAVGGNYEQLSVLNSVQTVVTDTPDQVLVNLSTASVTEDDTGVTFTATLTAPAGDAPVVVETTQGTITIAAGQSTGTLFVDTNDPDVYIDPDVVSATINSVSGGGFESLAVGVGSATANISDTIDPTTLSLSAPESVSEGGEITYTATVTNAPQSPLSINLSNGAQITIGVGQTSGSVTVAAPSDDVYVDEGSLSVNITSTLGGNYENLIIGNGEVSVLVEDTTDTVYAELSGESWVMEADGAELPHTITFVDENGAPAPLKSGETVTFTLAYQSTGEQPGEQLPPEDVEGQQPGIPLPPLPFLGMGDVEDEDFQVKYVEVTVTGNGGNTYEFANLVADDALAEFVEGYIVTLAGIKSDNSTFEDLQISPDNNGAVGVIEDEILHEEQPDLAYSFKLFAIVDGEYVDSATIAEDGGQGEYIVLAVDGNGVPLDSQDQPGGSITVYVGDQNDTADRGDDYVAGATITADVNDSFTIDAKDDDLAEGDEQFTLTLGQDWTEASTYEDVDYDTSVVSTTIVDDDNGTITVSAEIQVGENLITNGSFEQFPGSIADGGQKAFQSVDGWTIYSGDEMQIHSGSHNMSGGPNAVPLGAADGDYYMDMESSPNAIGIEQTISGLDAGNLYNLSFSVADKALADPGYYANNPQLGEYQGTTSTILEVYWNGGLVKTIHTGTTEWLEFSFDLEAQGGDNTLRFVEIGVDGDNHGSALDDIKLVDKAALLDIQGTVDNVSDGETVTLTITDGTNSQDVTTTVSGGQYTYNDFDITGWDETAIHVDAETTDTGGNKVTADTSVSKDITATVSDDSGSVTEDATATATGNVLDNDSDADTVLTVTGAGTYEGAYGTLILQANGDYTYTLNNGADKVQALDDNETVVDTFTYTAQDDVGNDHSANLVITINGADEPNVAPTSTNDSVSTPEGVNLTLSLNDFGVYADADNDALAAVKITALPVNGTLLLNSVAVQAGDAIAATQVSQGNLVFVPADSDTDADSAFQFQVQDAAGLWSGTYTTDVNIDAVADQPNVAITLGEPQGETPEVTDLPTAISHVKYMLSDGTTLKFEPYDANITDPTDPTQYIEAIETATGETVTAYYIKSANNVYDAWGNYVGGAINGDASNPLANQSDNTSDPDDYGSGSTYVFGGTSATYDYPVTVTASLNDTDGSESLTLWVTGVPEGATLQGASYNSEENRWELTTETDPEAETEVQLVLEGVPAGSGGFTLTATAVATETNPNGAVDTPTATNTATDRSEVPDVNDPPEFGQTSYSESYQENSATSVVLETVSATDPEGGAVSYAITANVQDGAGNDLFAIDSSGNITLTADGAVAFTNDYEASGNTHVLTVTAFDSQGNTADVQVTLTETNIADQLKQGDNTDNTLSTVGGDNDVLIGDAGGNQTNFDQGTNYNISLIVDTSGSMESRMALTEAALKNLADTLVNHSGSVNLQIVEFGSDLKSNVTFNDIDTSDLSAIESAIEALDDGSYTNYEAGFRAAEDWFSNQSNGYENMAFFLTDGEPNRYLDNSGNVRSGSDSSPEVMQESVEAFADLTALGVTVHGIGIGTGVSTGTLRYFDNTEVAGQETIVVVDEVLANFSGSGDPLDTSSDWTFSGTGGFSSYVEIGGGIFSPDDLSLVDGSKNGDPVVATSNSFSVAAGQVLRFDYDVEYLEGGDLASWSLERNDNGAWSSVAGSSALSGSGEVASQALAAGNYRLVFSVDNSSGDGGLLGGDDRLHIDNIELLSHVDAPYGQPQTVTDGDQLTAVLQGGNTVVTPHDVGDDILIGGDGDDIIFGDAVEHADFAGQGTEGLFNAIEQDEGLSNPSAAQVHQYLVDNEADLIFPASQGGDDELTGGRGNDLLIGGEGQDRFVWKAGDQGTEDHPAEDHVADFELGTDKLDLSDLFDIAAGKSIDDYLFAATEGGDTKLYVNTKGDFNGSQDKNLADQVITLDDQNTDLNTLINNNGLITD
ncbi:MAG: hypothetical protein CMI01_15215 [Oceanospirillaceae bacterium]|nr:hypothetical protein [Oceanospirillaceae bacterium]